MHFSTIVAIEIEPQAPDIITDAINEAEIKMLARMLEHNNKNLIAKIKLKRLQGLTNPFARAVEYEVGAVMEPYYEGTEDPKYLEFIDCTDELVQQYENEGIDSIRLADGRIVGRWDSKFYRTFVIRNGMIYQRRAGQLHHCMRTKKAKKMKLIPDYPYKKLYSTLSEFAEVEKDYCENDGQFGYYTNPQAFWDWYSIGGRWPLMFLVAESCEEFSIGERDSDLDIAAVPQGYKWVAAARKKDIAWDVMKDCIKDYAEKRYNHLRTVFEGEELLDDYGRITKNGIESHYLWYKAGESLEEYLERTGINKRLECYLNVYGFLDEDGWNTSESCTDNWVESVNEFIDSLDDNTVLVGVDCHM